MFASEKVMLDYLGQLLEDVDTQEAKPEPQEPELAPKLKPIVSKKQPLPEYKEPEPVEQTTDPDLERLLTQIEQQTELENKTKEVTKTVDLEVQKEQVVQPSLAQAQADVIPEEGFQALFFEVAGLVLAVPLQELGGIHNLSEINSIFGKPEWFKGVMLNRDSKLNVVDSARWVMPEKYDTNMENSLNYKYLITLGDSEWGLAAERLVETELIQPEQVKWRSGPGKRPWLFGTIKEKMCALLHVSDLIAMLEQGIDARQQ